MLSIPQCFEEQVALNGTRPAIIDRDILLTYAELDARRRHLAARLMHGLTCPASPDVTAVMCHHGADLIIAILACLTAGTAVVVLDPSEPPARWHELIDFSGARRWVVDEAHHATAVAHGQRHRGRVKVVEIAPAGPCPATVLDASEPSCEASSGTPAADESRAAHHMRRGRASVPRTAVMTPGALRGVEAEGAGEQTNSFPVLHESSVAFILFTSGTTGEAKGVLATHGNIVRNVRNYAHSAGLRPDDRMSLVSRLQYMAGISGVFGALLTGAAVAPFDTRHRGFRAMGEWLAKERITVLHLVPTLFRRFCESLDAHTRFDDVRLVKLGGESVTHHDLKLWRRHFSPGSHLLNGLGMSEANGNICHYHLAYHERCEFDVIPVGYPLPEVEIKLVDDTGLEVTAGDVGEIAFRCPHRSPGYWRSDDFEERFLPVPHTETGQAYFRTGDLGRFQPDGCLQHLGRVDRLLKLRGVRIEPAQIEASLLKDQRISQCAVGVHGEGSRPRQLVAWVVPAPGASLTPESIREFLQNRLPNALIPNVFVTLSSLPVTQGGKLDRGCLPAPRPRDAVRSARLDDHPRDALELDLLDLWRKMLRVPSVQPTHNFFDLGGDSLTAAAMVSKVEGRYQAEVDLARFFSSPTPRDLAHHIRSTTQDPTHQRLVLSRRGDGKSPFFFVPGAGAVGHPASATPEIGSRAHYIFQYDGIDGVTSADSSVESMARTFVEEVRRVQSDGPYLLGGGSFGALVALEAAQQLVEEGQRVALLVLEDALLDGCLTPARNGRLMDGLERALLWVLPVGRRFQLTKTGIRDGLRQWGYRLMWRWARWRAIRSGRRLAKVHRFHQILSCCLEAKKNYLPRPYLGKTVLLRARYQACERLFHLEPTLGWGALCPHLRTIRLDGEKGDRDHPGVRQDNYFAALETVLDEAASSFTTPQVVRHFNP